MAVVNNLVKKREHVIGIAALMISAVLTSASQVFYANHVQNTHPFIFTGVSFFLTAFFFSFISAKQKAAYQWSSAWGIIIKLNLSSVLAFMGFYFGLKFIEPAIVSSLEMGLGPLFAIILTTMQRKTVHKEQWWVSMGTLLACLLLITTVFSGNSGIQMDFNFNTILGILASIFCGLGAVLCTIYSKQLSLLGWTSSMILTHRYYAIVFLSFIFTYDLIFNYFIENAIWILIITVAGVLLPMYFLQKGIQHCKTFLVMMSLCFIPVFTFFFQLFDPRLSWSTTTLIGVLLLLFLGVCSVYFEAESK